MTPASWRGGRWGRVVPAVVFLLLVGAAIAVLGEELHRHLDGLERHVRALGPWGPLAFVATFAILASLLVPDTILAIAAGVLFGLAAGTGLVVAGALAGSTIQWALGRRALRERVDRIVSRRPSLEAIRRAVCHGGLRLQVLIRLTPLSPALVSYLLGAAGVRLGGFLLACLGLVPGLFMEVYVGYAGRHMASMAARSTASVAAQDVAILAGLAACIAVLAIVSRTARRAVAQAGAATA